MKHGSRLPTYGDNAPKGRGESVAEKVGVK